MKLLFIPLVIIFLFPASKVIYDCVVMNQHFGFEQFFSVYGTIFLVAFSSLIFFVYNKKNKIDK